MVQKRKYPFINGRSILYTILARTITSFRQNYKKNDNITSKWPRAGGATMSRAQTGYIIILRFLLKFSVLGRI